MAMRRFGSSAAVAAGVSTSAAMPSRRACSAALTSSSRPCSVLHSISMPRSVSVKSSFQSVGPLPIAVAAREVQVAQHRRRAVDVRLRCRAMELPGPAQQIGAQARLDVERALGIPHPPQPELHHAGTGQGNEVARHDHAGVDEGAAVAASASPLEEGDPCPWREQIVGDGKPDDPAADDEHSVLLTHVCVADAPAQRVRVVEDQRRFTRDVGLTGDVRQHAAAVRRR